MIPIDCLWCQCWVQEEEQSFDFVGDFVLDNDIEEDEDTKDIPKIIQQPIPEGYVSTNRNAWISEKNGGVIHRFTLPYILHVPILH